jgi:hypothetical protein
LIGCTTLHADGGISIANWPGVYYCSVGNWPQTQQVSVQGSVQVGNFPTSQPVSGTFWPAVQPVSGSVAVSNFPASASSAVVSRIAVGASVVTLASANSNRKRLIVFNETGTLRVKLGANASLTDYTYEILASAGNNRQDIDGYSGVVTAIKVSGSSFAQVTEF